MKKTKQRSLPTITHQIISKALDDIIYAKTFEEKTLEIEIIQIRENFVIEELIISNGYLKEFLSGITYDRSFKFILKAQSNFYIDFDDIIWNSASSFINLTHGIAYTSKYTTFYKKENTLLRDSAQKHRKTHQSNIVMIFSNESTTFEQIRDIATCFTLLNSHLKLCLRWLEETHLLGILSDSTRIKNFQNTMLLSKVLPMDDETEYQLEKVLEESKYSSQNNFYSSTLYFLSHPVPSECEKVFINELNTIPELTISKSSSYNLNQSFDQIRVDRYFAVRISDCRKKIKAKNKLLFMMHYNGIPISTDCLRNYIQKELVTYTPQQIFMQIDEKDKKLFFPKYIIPLQSISEATTVHFIVEYERFKESPPMEYIIVMNFDINPEVINNLQYSDLLREVMVGIVKDICVEFVQYLDSSKIILSKNDIFNSYQHKKLSKLECSFIPALSSLMSELSQEINISQNLEGFSMLPALDREMQLRKAITDICLYERALNVENCS